MVRIALALLSSLCAFAVLAAEPVPPGAQGFVPNLGQFDARVAYQAQLADRAVFVARDGAVVQQFVDSAGRAWALVERWSDAGSDWRAVGPERASVTWIGDRDRRHGGIHARLRRDEVWPGVSAELRLGDGGVESQFDLAPGTDASVVAVQIAGADAIAARDDGGLQIATGIGALAVSPPLAWQVIDGVRTEVPVRYALREGGYGFAVGAHDPNHALHIDPVLRSTFVGGGSDEWVDDLVLADDSVYVSGYSKSANFPGTTGGFQPAIIRSSTLLGNAFVARYSRDLTQLLQATYFGSANGSALTIQQMALGNDSLYIVGNAPAGSLPTGQSPGAQASAGSGQDAFVARLATDLRSLQASSYFGGDQNDSAHGVSMGGDGVYVAGSTSSSNLPGRMAGAVPTIVNQFNADAFVARFSADLGTLHASSYLSGAGNGGADARDVLVDADGVYIAGHSSGGLLNTSGAFQPGRGNGGFTWDGFIARFSHDLGTLHRATYLGGSGEDRVWRLAANDTAIYGAGDTKSGNFPIAANAPDTTAGGGEGFVFAISRDLTTRIGGTFLGGSGSTGDSVGGLAVDAMRVFVAGTTASTDFPGATGGAEPANPSGAIVGFVARFDPVLSVLQQSSYYGVGTGQKQVYGFGVDAGDVYLGGRMPGGTLPNSAGSAQPNHGGGAYDGFIGLFSADLQPPQPQSDLAITKTGSPDLEYNHYLIYTIEVRNLGPDAVSGAAVSDLLPGAQLIAANWMCGGSAGGSCGSASGSGSISTLVSLPVGGVATFTLCARYDGGGADVVNTATVAPPANHGDPNPGNNSATHAVADPSLFKDGFEEAMPPSLCSGL